MDPVCPPPLTTYLVLDIQTGPGLDQQVYDAVVALIYGHHERRPAILHHEWTCRGSKGARVDRRVGGGARRDEVEREREGRGSGESMRGSFESTTHDQLPCLGHPSRSLTRPPPATNKLPHHTCEPTPIVVWITGIHVDAGGDGLLDFDQISTRSTIPQLLLQRCHLVVA